MDSLTGLTVFARVVEKGGFTAAAHDLGISKSTVSKQIASLENRLGVRLLNRTTRSMTVTEIGRAYFERAQRIVTEAEEAELAVTRLHQEPRGALRVNAPMSFGITHLARLIPEFMATHPDLAIDLEFNDRRVDLIDEGYDLAIRIGRLAESSLVARKLAPSRVVVVASPKYWRRAGKPKVPSDLQNHECLIYGYRDNPNEWAFHGPDGPFTQRISGRIRANNGEALMAAAVAGLGAYQCPTFLCSDHVATGRVEIVLGEYEAPEPAVYAVWPHNRHLSAKVRSFVDFLIGRFGPHPYWDANIPITQRPLP